MRVEMKMCLGRGVCLNMCVDDVSEGGEVKRICTDYKI